MARRDQRSTEASAYRKLYKTSRWQRLRERQLTAHPLCAYCLQQEDVTPATVCDHVRPHKGDEALFFDPDNLQSLCAPCHDRIKQREELGQDVVRFGPDGWPVSWPPGGIEKSKSQQIPDQRGPTAHASAIQNMTP